MSNSPSLREGPLTCNEIHPIPSRAEQARKVTPFDQWKPPNISIPRPPTEIEYTDDNVRDGLNGWSDEVATHARDSFGKPLVELGVDHSTEHQEAKRRERQRRQNEKGNKFYQVPLENSWKLGVEGSTWTEKRTCSVNVDPSRPPFQRLLDATLDFFYSRTRAFDDMETRSRFNALRYVLGLKSDIPGQHWPGTGPHASWYTMTHNGRKWANKQQLEDYDNGVIGEICPLVRCPELAVRGYIAMLRRETDATWELSRAIASAEIFAALMGYFELYEVITDEQLAPAFHRAIKLAKAGPRLLREAFQLEEAVDKITGFNHAGWALIGGSYLHRDVDGYSEQVPVSSDTQDAQNLDDGGWGVGSEDGTMRTEVTRDQAKQLLSPLLNPLPAESVRLLNYLPYSRRIITAVIPPEQAPGPVFTTTFYRLRTASAPWSPDERWREPSPRRRADMENAAAAQDEPDDEAVETLTFELEQSTIKEPDELDFWVDGKELVIDADGSWLVGMGLRARWAQIGTDEENSWWIARLKDYVLPSIWRMTPEEREIAKGDPPSPYEKTVPRRDAETGLVDGGEKDGKNTAMDTRSGNSDAGPDREEVVVADTNRTSDKIDGSALKVSDPVKSAGQTQVTYPSHSEAGLAAPGDTDEDDELPGVIAVDAGEEDMIDFDDDFDDDVGDGEDLIAVISQAEEADASDDEDISADDKALGSTTTH